MTFKSAMAATVKGIQFSTIKSIIEPRYAIQYNQDTLPALLGSQSTWMKF